MDQPNNMTVLHNTLEEITSHILEEAKQNKIKTKKKISNLSNKMDKLKENIDSQQWSKLERQMELLQDKLEKLINKEQDYLRLNKYFTESGCTAESSYNNIYSENGGLKFLEIQEVERHRIARELHDSTVQNLTNIVHVTEFCSKLVDKDPIRAKLELQVMSNTIKSTINDMREIIYNLRPMSLDDLGFSTTVKQYVQQFIESSTCQVFLKVNNERKIDNDILELTLFRIIQEACSNSIKHGNPSIITICLDYYNTHIKLSVKDNGKGFNNESRTVEKSNNSCNNKLNNFGLSMMKERVNLLSGRLEVKSELNKGTEISVYVPVKFNKTQK